MNFRSPDQLEHETTSPVSPFTGRHRRGLCVRSFYGLWAFRFRSFCFSPFARTTFDVRAFPQLERIPMASQFHRPISSALYPAETQIESRSSAIAWSAIWAGAIVAAGVSLILLSLGSGFGLAVASPWPGVGPKAETFSVGAAIWLVVTQWVSSLFGGYVAGRTRTRWNNLHTDEVFFRDTVHGLLTWALATVALAIIAILASSLAAGAATPSEVPLSREAADAARQIAAKAAIVTGVSLLIGAFIASVAAAFGGHLRDEHP
jgi:hypothetical protein